MFRSVVLKIMSLLVMMLMLAGCMEKKIDGSSPEAFSKSIKEVNESLGKEERARFLDSLSLLMIQDVNIFQLPPEPSIALLKSINVVSGMTAKEVIAKADTIRAEAKAKRDLEEQKKKDEERKALEEKKKKVTEWKIETQNMEMSERKITSASIYSSDLSASLFITCSGKDKRVFIFTDEYLGDSITDVCYRFGDDKARCDEWDAVDGGKARTFNESISSIVFIYGLELNKSKNMKVQVFDFSRNSYVYNFNISGVSNALKRIYSECGIKEPVLDK